MSKKRLYREPRRTKHEQNKGLYRRTTENPEGQNMSNKKWACNNMSNKRAVQRTPKDKA